jgi:hypothetical protein
MPMPDEEKRQTVVVTDIRMPFFSMVVFMVKWAIAAIPAFFILTVIGVFTWGMLSGLILSLTTGKKADSIHATGVEVPFNGSSSNARAPKPVALSSVKLEYQYSKSRSNILFLNFTVSNGNSHPVRDYTISCNQYGDSGTLLGSISKKVYGNVQAKGKQDFDGFEMGLVDSQIKLVSCEVTDLVAA